MAPSNRIDWQNAYRRLWQAAQTGAAWTAEMSMQLSLVFMAGYAASTGDASALPAWITVLATGLGPNVLVNRLEKLARSGKDDSDIAADLAELLNELDFEAVMSRQALKDEINRAFETQEWIIRAVAGQSEERLKQELRRLFASHGLGTDAVLAALADIQSRLDELAPAQRLPLQKLERAEHFTGREDELATLLDQLQPGQVAVLSGPGGIGKTALAAEALHRLAPGSEPPARFPDGIVVHSFYNQPQAELALNHIVSSYGEKPEPNLETAVRRVLGGRAALLVLDGAEEADDLQQVLDLRAGCGVLITSRKPETGARQAIQPLPMAKAVALLRRWLPAQKIEEEDGRAIAHLLGRLPLALRLAGSYMQETAEQAAEFLADLAESPLDKLDQGRRRRESVPVLLAKSLQQVDAGARQALAVLAQLALDEVAKDVVAAGLDQGEAQTRRHLGQLVAFGLLGRAAGGRYRLSHALIHTYGRERLTPPAGSLERLAAYYVDFLETEQGRERIDHARLVAERQHLLAVVTRCQTAAAWAALQTLAYPVYQYLGRAGHWAEQELVTSVALNGARQAGDEGTVAAWHNNLGLVYANQGEWGRAIERYEASLAIKERLGDVHGMAQTYNNLGMVYANQGEWGRAIERYEASLALKERLGDVHGMARTYNNLGMVYAKQGEWGRAIERYEASLAIKERLGDVHGMAQTYNNLGSVYLQQGEWGRAIEYYEKDLAISERLGDVHGMAQTMGNLGSVYLQQGEWGRAIESYEASLATFERLGDVHGMSQSLMGLGMVYAKQGEWGRAIERYEASLAIKERLGDVHGMAQTWGNLGMVYAKQGEWGRAIEYYEKDLAISERLGDVHGMAQTYHNLGSVYLQQGEWGRAIERYEASLALKERLGDVHGMAQTWGNLGYLYRDQGDVEQAKAYAAQSYLVLSQLGAWEAEQIGQLLVDLTGSANAYLAQFAQARQEEE